MLPWTADEICALQALLHHYNCRVLIYSPDTEGVCNLLHQFQPGDEDANFERTVCFSYVGGTHYDALLPWLLPASAPELAAAAPLPMLQSRSQLTLQQRLSALVGDAASKGMLFVLIIYISTSR